MKRTYSGNVTYKYAWELDFLRKIRDFRDGISFFELNFNLDLFKGDHNPKFEFIFIILNFKIVEFGVYNRFHVEDDEYETSFPIDKEW